MKLALVSILSIFVFSTNAIADHHGHSAGKLSMTSNGEFLLDTTNVGGQVHHRRIKGAQQCKQFIIRNTS